MLHCRPEWFPAAEAHALTVQDAREHWEHPGEWPSGQALGPQGHAQCHPGHGVGQADRPALAVSPPGMIGRVHRLEEAGLVMRRISEEDGRSRVVALTCRGRELIDQALTEHMRHERALLDDLTLIRPLNRRPCWPPGWLASRVPGPRLYLAVPGPTTALHRAPTVRGHCRRRNWHQRAGSPPAPR